MVKVDAYVRKVRGHTHSVYMTWQLLEGIQIAQCPLAHLKRYSSPGHIPKQTFQN